MPSVWSWLSGLKRGVEKSEKSPRHPDHHRRPLGPGRMSGSGYMDTEVIALPGRMFGSGYMDTEVTASRPTLTRSQQNFIYSTEHQHFGYAPEIARDARLDPAEVRERHVSQQNKTKTKQGAAKTKQNVAKTRQTAANTRANYHITSAKPAWDISRAGYVYEPSPVYFDDHFRPHGAHHETPSYMLGDHRSFPIEHGYSRRATEMGTEDNLSMYVQKRPGVFHPIARRPDHGLERGYNPVPYEQQTRHFVAPSRDDFGGNVYMPPQTNSYIPGVLAMRQLNSDVYAGHERRVRQPENRGSDAISTYVPRVMGQRDVSAFLFGVPEQELSFPELKKPLSDSSTENFELNSRHPEQMTHLRDVSSALHHSVSKEARQKYLQLEDDARYFKQTTDNKINIYGKTNPGSSNLQHRNAPGCQTQPEKDQKRHNLLGASRSSQWDSSYKTFQSIQSPTSGVSFLATEADSGVSQLDGSYRDTTGRDRRRWSNSDSSSPRSIPRQSNKVLQRHADSIQDSRNRGSDSSRHDGVTEVEVRHALAQLDMLSNADSERDVQRELERIFEGEGEVFY